MTTQEQRVEFHVALMDYKRALRKALRGAQTAKSSVAILRAEVALMECHEKQMDEAASEALSVALRNATPHTFEVTECEPSK